MAAYAACIHAGTKLRFLHAVNSSVHKLAFVPTTHVSSSSSSLSSPHCRRFDFRQISQLVQSNGKRLFLVDTLALVRRLEGQGVPSKQAEAITSAITEVLNDSLENVAQSFVSKGEMQRIEMTQDGNLGKFKSQVQSSQENHFSLLQRETEKLRNDIEKMRSELRYEIDKVTAGQRLDLNLERGRIRDELANQNQETANLTNKLDRRETNIMSSFHASPEKCHFVSSFITKILRIYFNNCWPLLSKASTFKALNSDFFPKAFLVDRTLF